MNNQITRQRLFYTLFFTQSLFSAAQFAVGTLVAIVVVRLGGTESVAGLPASASIFAQALAALPIAIVMGRFGRRLGLSLGYAAGAFGGLIGVIAIVQGIFPLLLLSAVLLGMARASSEQGRFVAAEMFAESERARMVGRLIFAGTIGAVAGPALVAPSGRLMEYLGLQSDAGPWAAMFILCTVASLLIFLQLRPDPMVLVQANAASKDMKLDKQPESARPLGMLLTLPKVQLAILAAIISQTVMVVIMVMTPLHMHHHHHGTEAISLVIAMHILGMFGLSPVTGYLIDRYGRIPNLVVGGLMLLGAALLAPISANQYILAGALFLLGLGWNFGYVSASSLLADALQGEERTRVQGINDSLVFLAAGCGSLGAGVLFASGGYVSISIVGSVLAVVMISVIFWYNRPQLRAEAAELL